MLAASTEFRRRGFIALIASLAVIAGLATSQSASAQTRATIVRDTDNADLATAFFYFTVTVDSTVYKKVTTVPAGKRLVVDNVSYNVTPQSTSTDSTNQLSFATLGTLSPNLPGVQPRLIFQINPTHAYTPTMNVAITGHYVTP